MWISRLSLANFRNYAQLELSLNPRMVVFQGDNAQGKSNLLEAVYFLAATRSPRTSSDSELINREALKEAMAVTRVTAQVHKAGGTLELEAALRYLPAAPADSLDSSPQPQAKRLQKLFRVNGVVRYAAEVIGQLNAVMFSTLDIELLTSTPALRRRFLDITNSQIDSNYLRTLQQYNRTLLQRNNLLRLIAERHAQPEQLEFWNRELVAKGCYLTIQRQQLITSLSGLARQAHQQLSGGQETLEIVYQPNLGAEVVEERQAPAISQAFQQKLQQALQRETYLGMTIVGPHRDDVQFLVNGTDIGVYGSRGQQRSVALSLKLAERQFMLAMTNEQPILLLDDVLSELDIKRRSHLLEAISSHEQTLVTTTDLEHLGVSITGQAMVFQISQGKLSLLRETS